MTTESLRPAKAVDAGLVNGLGTPKPGQMCVEAAICYALGYRHGDQPKCVAECIRQYKIRINDGRWSSNEARTKGMRRAAIAQLGSTEIDQKAWAKYVVEQVIRRILPISLRNAAEKHKDKIHAERLIEAALRCENEGSRDAANDAAYAANAAYAASASAYAAATNAYRDNILNIAAEICVEACIKTKTQGSKWLDLTEAA